MNKYLLLVLAAAFFLRFAVLSQVGLSHDELENINNGISLVQTGKDLNGDFLPLTIGGVGLVAIPAYIAGLGALVFGQSVTGVRVLAVVLGTLDVLFLYLIAKKLINGKAAIFAAAGYAVSPWGIHFSRIMYDPPVALFFALAGICALLYAKTMKNISLAWLLIGLAALSYYGFIFTIPFVIVLLFWFRRKDLGKRGILAGMVIVAAAYFVLAAMIGVPQKSLFAGKRTGEIIFLQKERLSEKVIFERSQSGAPELVNKIFLNKATVAFSEISANYLSAFNPESIFSFGEASLLSSPKNAGFLYLAELPLVIVGAYSLFIKKRKSFMFILLMILVAPATMALSDNRTYMARLSLLFPFLLILSGYGVYRILENLKKHRKQAALLLAALYLVSVSGFLYEYFYRYPVYAKEIWFDSERQVAEYLVNSPGKTTVVSTVEPRETFMEYAFYGKLTSREMQNAYQAEGPIFVKNIMFRDCIAPTIKPEEVTLILDRECYFDMSGATDFIRSREGANEIRWGIFN